MSESEVKLYVQQLETDLDACQDFLLAVLNSPRPIAGGLQQKARELLTQQGILPSEETNRE